MKNEVLEAYGNKKLEEYSHWVYILECNLRKYHEHYDDYEKHVTKRIGYKPKWVRMAWEANRCVYIGQTENLEKRLGEHFKNKRSSDFTTVWEPRHIVLLKPVTSRNSAEYKEEKLGQSYYDSDNTFAWWS